MTETPIYLSADKLHLNNVLTNLLDNALKYCKVIPHAQIHLEHRGEQALLKIKDNGIGISKEDQKKIYDKFFRIPTGDVHDVKGFGLGLYYVKSICDSHGWKLHLDSTPHEGTTVSLVLPIIKNAYS